MTSKIEEFACTRLDRRPELTPRRNVKVIKGLGPDGLVWDFHIMPDKMKFITEELGTGAIWTMAKCVPHVLSDSAALVFQGLRVDGHTEGLCYIGGPPSRYDAAGRPYPPAGDDMFFVFVNEERTVYTWRWETVTTTNPDNTFGGRFTRRVR